MPMELRKRKTPAAPPPPPRAKKAKAAVTETAKKVKTVVAPKEKAEKAEKSTGDKVEKAEEKKEETKAEVKETAKEKKEKAKKEEEPPKLKAGDKLSDTLPAVKTEEGKDTTLKALLDESKSGIVVFAYPAASTPGCTTQACAFRDNYSIFTEAGYSVYGISGDAPEKNQKFKKNKELPYTLLSDNGYILHEELGIKKAGAKAGTVRSVTVIGKDGIVKVLERGGPLVTYEAAKKAIGK